MQRMPENRDNDENSLWTFAAGHGINRRHLLRLMAAGHGINRRHFLRLIAAGHGINRRHFLRLMATGHGINRRHFLRLIAPAGLQPYWQLAACWRAHRSRQLCNLFPRARLRQRQIGTRTRRPSSHMTTNRWKPGRIICSAWLRPAGCSLSATIPSVYRWMLQPGPRPSKAMPCTGP